MTTTTDLAAAVRRLDAAIVAGDVIRGEWTRTEDGRERACLLASLAPACGVRKSAAACPAEVLPAWFAECVPWIDDSGSEAAWGGMIRDFADLLRDSVDAQPELWARLHLRWRRGSLAEAMAHTDDLAALGVCAEVAAMLDAELAGESIDPVAWTAAEVTTVAAWPAASAAATWVAMSATSAATWSPQRAVRARTSADAAAAAAGARRAAQAAADRITFEFFAAWRAELDAQTTGDRS